MSPAPGGPPGGARARVLVVDDEPRVRTTLRAFLEAKGFEVLEAADAEGCCAAFRAHPPDVAVLDHHLGDRTALDVLPSLRAIDAEVPVVVLTGHATIDLAVRAIKEGAEHFFTKPVEPQALLVVLERTMENRRSRRRRLAANVSSARQILDPFVGASRAIRDLAEQARRVLGSDSPVLIVGETGTGKGVLAAWLHARGTRAEEPFVDLNCAGLSKDFLDSELFGHERGAFTGATAEKLGLLEVAHRGTVFLDEIGDMDPAVQAKVLKALEERRFRRMGDVHDRRVDVRMVAATHRDLGRLAAEGGFRADLYFRISALQLAIPPLRERVEDVPDLAERLLEHASRTRSEPLSLSPAALRALQGYAWPGNIRELRNVLERAAVLTDGRVIDTDALRFEPARGAPREADAGLTLAEVERRHIERVLREEGGRVAAAAQRLAVPRSSLYQRIKQYGLKVPKG